MITKELHTCQTIPEATREMDAEMGDKEEKWLIESVTLISNKQLLLGFLMLWETT
jgi:hypothetical protein